MRFTETWHTRAISEVFGVMLILAITIIVAGIIAAFASGFSLDTGTDMIQANIVCSEFVPSGTAPYLVFDHLSGDPVNLNEIEIVLGNRSSSRDRTIISNRQKSGYIVGYGDDDTRVRVGGRFVLNADDCNDDNVFWGTSPSNRFTIGSSEYLTYQIIDTRSQHVLSSGMIAVPSHVCSPEN